MSVKKAVAGGDRAEILKALQQRLAEEIEHAEGAALAALSHQLRMATAELNAAKPSEESLVDEIAARRTARKARASDT